MNLAISRGRKRFDIISRALVWIFGLTCASLFVGVIGVVAWKGLGAINSEFLTSEIVGAGDSGGIIVNVAGTLILVGTAALVALPIGSAIALAAHVYLKPGGWRHFLAMSVYVLNGLPSILIGIFGYLLFVRHMDWGKSWLSGGILLGLMIVPTIAVAFAERLAMVPKIVIESARGLGLNKSQLIRHVLLPRCRGSLITGLLLGLGRAAGETAPIMFTATVFAGATLPNGVRDNPVLSLPYHIFVLAQDSATESARSNLWGAALVLLVLVISTSLAALPMRARLFDASNENHA